jgi:hypothetical protein
MMAGTRWSARQCLEADTRALALEAAADVMSLWLEVAAERGFGPLDETAELVGAKVAEVIAA